MFATVSEDLHCTRSTYFWKKCPVQRTARATVTSLIINDAPALLGNLNEVERLAPGLWRPKRKNRFGMSHDKLRLLLIDISPPGAGRDLDRKKISN